jgi:hypothetical protein
MPIFHTNSQTGEGGVKLEKALQIKEKKAKKGVDFELLCDRN